MSGVTLSLTATPSAEELTAIGEGLAAYNEASVGPAERVALAVLVRDGAGAIRGGLSGYTGWGWLYVQWLWLDERMRGQRLAERMLGDAEGEARRRGCLGAYIDTFNPVALKVYQRAGYAVFGELEDFPKGRTRRFLQKRL